MDAHQDLAKVANWASRSFRPKPLSSLDDGSPLPLGVANSQTEGGMIDGDVRGECEAKDQRDLDSMELEPWPTEQQSACDEVELVSRNPRLAWSYSDATLEKALRRVSGHRTKALSAPEREPV